MAHNNAEQDDQPEEPVRFTDRRRIDPETGEPRQPGSEGEASAEDQEAAEAGDRLQDPLENSEEILGDVPVEDAEDIETLGGSGESEAYGSAGDPVAAHEAAGETSPDADPQVSEEPELDEIPGEQAAEQAAGGIETEPDDIVAEAEQILGEEGEVADARVADGSAREAELENDLRRVQAEYVNYRRRVERDRTVQRDRTVGELLSTLMPVLDDLHAARQAGDLEDGPFAAIAKKLETILDQQGLERIDEVGAPFDPNVHEAVMQQPHQEIPEDHVAVVLRPGYCHGERVIRAAQVAVSSGAADGAAD